MTKQEQLEQKVLDTKAASEAADKAVYSYSTWVACADAAGAYLEAKYELEEYIKEQVNEF
jgi:hypothetical protein